MKCRNSCKKGKREGRGCQAVREGNGERRGRQGRLGGGEQAESGVAMAEIRQGVGLEFPQGKGRENWTVRIVPPGRGVGKFG